MIKQICKWSLLVLLMPLLTVQQTIAQEAYNLSFFAGTRSGGYAGDNGPAKDARFYRAEKIAKDQYGNLYVADGARLRVINPNGIVYTLAGLDASSPNTAGDFDIHDIAVEQSSNDIYLLEKSKHQVRLIDNSIQGIMSIAAGTGVSGFSGDGGLAFNAQLNSPSAVVTDKLGNVYIADDGNRRIRRIDASTRMITTIAGTGVSGYTGDGGLATQAQLTQVTDLAIDKDDNLYIAQVYGQVRKINLTTGIITTVAGSTPNGSTADGVPATQARLSSVMGVDVDAAGNIYIASMQYMKKVEAASGLIYTIAGNGSLSPNIEGNALDVSVIAMGVLVANDSSIYMGERSNINKLTIAHTDGMIVADHVEGIAGKTVKVPVRAQNLSAFAGLQLNMNFPSDKASFVGLTNINTKLGGFGNDNYNEATPGNVIVVWTDAAVQNQTFANNEVLFEIELNIAANVASGEQLFITFDSANSMFIDKEVKELNVGYKQGSVTVTALSKITGLFKTFDNQPVKRATMIVNKADGTFQMIANKDDGTYSIGDLLPGTEYTILFVKSLENSDNGVDVGDLAAMRRHILGQESLDSPYKIIAADINISSSIDLIDMTLLQRMILGEPVTLTKSWRFIPASYTFVDPTNPLAEAFPTSHVFTATSNDVTEDIISIKVGDLNGTVDPTLRTTTQAIELSTPSIEAMNGDVIRIPVMVGANYSQVIGLQGSLEFDPKVLEYQGIEAAALSVSAGNFNTNNAGQGVISFLYDHPKGGADSFESGQVLYYLNFKAIGNAGQAAAIALTSSQTKATAYSQGVQKAATLRLNAGEVKLIEPVVTVYPNPAKNFNVQFEVTAEESKVTFTLKDQQGKTVSSREATFAQGQHTVNFEPNVIAGNYFLTIEYNQHKIVKKVMIK
jgi:hypothetical protein